jgi:hypothetical protein
MKIYQKRRYRNLKQRARAKTKSHHPYVAHLFYDADTSEDCGTSYRPRSFFDPPAPSQAVENPVPQHRNK